MFGSSQRLTQRLLLFITLTVMSAFVITVSVQYLALKPMLENTRQLNISASTENISPLISQALWSYDFNALEAATQALLRDQFISGVTVIDEDSQIRVSLGEPFEGEVAFRLEQQPRQQKLSQSLQFVVPLWIDSYDRPSHIGTVFITANDELLQQQISSLLNVTLYVSFFVISFLLLVIYQLTTHVVAKPLIELTEHVQQQGHALSSGSELKSASLDARFDEIGRLYQEFTRQHLAIIDRDRDILAYRDHLEETVTQRTQELQTANDELLASLDQLQMAQKELIQQEKLASLGALVSGIAHEVNTPLGVAITAASNLAEELRQTESAFSEGTLTKTAMEQFFENGRDTETLLSKNLIRAGDLIRSFKQVAVDQASGEAREIELHEYIDEIILSLSPKYKNTGIKVLNTTEAMTINTTPGAITQIISNLITNSISHAFDSDSNQPTIEISSRSTPDTYVIVYQDNGHGMDSDTLKRMYDPFFTTKRGKGGSGLGMNIVYNLITSKLKGSVETTSTLGQGTCVTMTFSRHEPLQEEKHER